MENKAMLATRHTMVEFSAEERVRSAGTVCGGLLAPFREPAGSSD